MLTWKDLPAVPAVYMIRNTITGDCYIGQSCNLRNRIRSHIRILKRQTACSRSLQDDYNVYGSDVFSLSVLEYLDDVALHGDWQERYHAEQRIRRTLRLRERFYIASLEPIYNSRDITYSPKRYA